MFKTLKVTDVEAFSQAEDLLLEANFTTVGDKSVSVSGGSILWGEIAFEAMKEPSRQTLQKEDSAKAQSLSERFTGLYGKSMGDESSWAVFIEKVVSEFYQKYSLLIYDPISGGATDGIAKKLSRLFQLLTANPSGKFYLEQTEGVPEKICIANVKIRVELGGAPIPAIVSFYFKLKEDGKYVEQLSAVRSRQLDRQIKELGRAAKSERKQRSAKMDISGAENYKILVDAVTSELKNTLKNTKDGFGEYLIWEPKIQKKVAEFILDSRQKSEKEKSDILNAMTEQEMQSLIDGAKDVEVYCTGAQLRYVAVLDCYCPTYNCFDSEDPSRRHRLFKIAIDLAWKINVDCGKCGESLIAESVLQTEDRNISFSLAGELLSAEAEKYLQENPPAAFAKHVQTKRCEWTGGNCEKLTCSSLLKTCSEDDFSFCTDCDHEEVVTFVEGEDGAQEPFLTKHLVFARDSFSLLPKDSVRRCKICGRLYARGYLEERGGVCTFCAPLANGSEEQRYRKLFKQHKRMLPYLLRFGRHGICNEDDGVVMFRVREKFYFLDKDALAADEQSKNKAKVGYIRLKKISMEDVDHGSAK